MITLNRPARRNSINYEVAESLHCAITWFANDETIQAGVMAGDQRAFSSGGDISMFSGFAPGDGARFTLLGHTLLDKLEASSKPMIAAVNGYCLAGGLEIALACDFIVAGGSAVFGFGEVGLGLIPGWGGTVRATRALPVRKARQFILTSERISADQARELGIVNECVADEVVVERAVDIARNIAAAPPLAVAAALKVIGAAAGHGEAYEWALAAERAHAGKLFESPESREQIALWFAQRARSTGGHDAACP